MRKIKIFRIHDIYTSDGYDEYSQKLLGTGVSDWNEVSDEDFDFIQSNLYQISKKYPRDQIVIVEQVADDIPTVIKDIKSELRKIQEEEDKRRQEIDRKKEEAAEKRAAKKLERDRKALERLVKDNPSLINEITQQQKGE